MTMEFGRDKTALVVVDMQNSYCRAGGRIEKLGFPFERLAAAEPGCIRLVAAARKAGVPVIYTQYVYQPDYKDGGFIVNEIMPALKDVGLCALGSWDAEILETLAPGPNDAVIQKNRPSAFYSTQLESVLAAMKIKNLVFCGVTTNMCVETTVRDACQRDFRCFVVSDAVGEIDDDRAEVALMTMGFFFARVLTADEVFESWKVPLSNVA
ncbi:MAG: cysteine hydrolase [Proteobacteria bacterium]|nr:cysteine hydrolase [Pseudomonadota bacterium]MDA1057923.1 cysteine hydrolase [Pseudomonadota bacterium]